MIIMIATVCQAIKAKIKKSLIARRKIIYKNGAQRLCVVPRLFASVMLVSSHMPDVVLFALRFLPRESCMHHPDGAIHFCIYC
jgi:hypothetical protein